MAWRPTLPNLPPCERWSYRETPPHQPSRRQGIGDGRGAARDRGETRAPPDAALSGSGESWRGGPFRSVLPPYASDVNAARYETPAARRTRPQPHQARRAGYRTDPGHASLRDVKLFQPGRWMAVECRSEPPIHWEEGMPASETGTARPGVGVGPTSEFSLFFHVRPGHGDALREALRTLQDHPGYRPGDYNMAIATIHEARFVLFDDDTRLLFATSFDGPWDAYMEDFFTSGPTLELFDAVFTHVEGYEGLPDVAAVKAFVLGAQVTAAAYARNYGGTVKEIRKAERVNKAFQRVLDDPEAGEALQHPALQPLLAEAAD